MAVGSRHVGVAKGPHAPACIRADEEAVRERGARTIGVEGLRTAGIRLAWWESE
jgi:hypothetical protein